MINFLIETFVGGVLIAWFSAVVYVAYGVYNKTRVWAYDNAPEIAAVLALFAMAWAVGHSVYHIFGLRHWPS